MINYSGTEELLLHMRLNQILFYLSKTGQHCTLFSSQPFNILSISLCWIHYTCSCSAVCKTTLWALYLVFGVQKFTPLLSIDAWETQNREQMSEWLVTDVAQKSLLLFLLSLCRLGFWAAHQTEWGGGGGGGGAGARLRKMNCNYS